MRTKKKLVPIRVESWFHKELKKRAFSLGISTNKYICMILEDHMGLGDYMKDDRKITIVK